MKIAELLSLNKVILFSLSYILKLFKSVVHLSNCQIRQTTLQHFYLDFFFAVCAVSTVEC